jgi:hypothetical protein
VRHFHATIYYLDSDITEGRPHVRYSFDQFFAREGVNGKVAGMIRTSKEIWLDRRGHGERVLILPDGTTLTAAQCVAAADAPEGARPHGLEWSPL